MQLTHKAVCVDIGCARGAARTATRGAATTRAAGRRNERAAKDLFNSKYDIEKLVMRWRRRLRARALRCRTFFLSTRLSPVPVNVPKITNYTNVSQVY
jgi:hypothetical protein